VDGQQVTAGRPGRDPGGAPDQRLALGAAGERDDHPLPRLPGVVDAVRRAVPLQALVDLVGQPEQRELAQRVQVPGPEVVAERGVDLLRRVDVPVRHPAPQRLGGHVDELDLVGRADDLVGDGLPLRHAGDLLDHVVERLQVLDVDRGDDLDAGLEQFLDVLPALLVPGSGHVAVRELVDQRDFRRPREHAVDVHLLEGGAAVGQSRPRHDLQACQLVGGVLPAVRLHERHHHVGAALPPAVTLAEHGERLADPGGGAEVDPQLPPRPGAWLAALARLALQALMARLDWLAALAVLTLLLWLALLACVNHQIPVSRGARVPPVCRPRPVAASWGTSRRARCSA